MKNWKWRYKYYTFKNIRNSDKWFIKEFHSYEYGKNFYTYITIVCDNIFREIICTNDDFVEHDMTDEEFEYFNSVFEKETTTIKNLDELKSYVLKIINTSPKLVSQTLIGNASNDMADNPNWFSGIYFLPDENYYGLVLHKGIIKVFKGKTDYIADLKGVVPLLSIKINLRQWADKITKDSNIIIEEINE